VTDQSGHGNHGSVSGALFASEGVLGGAYHFDGTDLIAAGNVADLSGSTTQLTVCAWIKAPPVVGGQWDMIIAKQQVPVPYRGWMLSLDPISQPGSQIIATHPDLVYAGGLQPICDGQWHFLCATFESSPTLMKTLLYVDGQFAGHDERAAVHGSTSATSPLTVGSRAPGSTQGYTGFIDEVRVYRRLLAADEVRRLYDSVQPDPDTAPYVVTLGFSNDPDGEQDVTEFFADETLYITLRDVNVDPANPRFTARVFLQQPGLKGPRSSVAITQNMVLHPDGSFTAAIPLTRFHAGAVRVAILADNRAPGYWLQRVSLITIMPQP